jgi:Domain of unknown function (DUF4304)
MPTSVAEESFRELLNRVHGALKPHGFRRHKQRFVRETAECWTQFGLEKGRWSTTEQKDIYGGVAVASKRLLRFEGRPDDVPPPMHQCHWRCDVSRLTPDKHQLEWALTDDQLHFEEASLEIIASAEKIALPALATGSTDEGLLKLYSVPYGPSAFEAPKLRHELVLLVENGASDRAMALIARYRELYRQTEAAPHAEDFIARLKQRYPGAFEHTDRNA